MNKKSLLCSLLIISIFNSTTVFANPITFGTQSIKQQINDTNTQLSRAETENKIQMLDNEIQNAMIDINNGKAKMAEVEKNVIKTQADIKTAQKKADDFEKLCKQRLRVLYMNGGTNSYLEALLGSTSFGDFIERLDAVKAIAQYDKKNMDAFQKELQVIQLKKKDLESQKEQLASIQAQNEQKLQSLEKAKDEQKKILAQFGPARTNKAEIDKALSLIKLNTTSLSRGGNVVTASNTVRYASNFLGTPYVWGGTTPDGFDCSGFTQYVFAHMGIDIPRVAEDQQKVGYSVPLSELQPGDLVFNGDPAHHVGIYVGNGYMINAPHTGDVVKISPIASDANARRIIK